MAPPQNSPSLSPPSPLFNSKFLIQSFSAHFSSSFAHTHTENTLTIHTVIGSFITILMAASMWSLLLIISTSSLVSSTLAKMPTSTISAAPALHPTIPPLTSPPPAAPSPDMNPLFPSPSGDGLSPSDNSLPIIPSSPSPPNPDDMAPSGPTDNAMSPSGSLPVSQASRLVGYIASSSYSSSIVVLCTSLAFWYGV